MIPPRSPVQEEVSLRADVEGRTLICCFDGTGNEYDNTNTNVVKLCTVLRKDDRGQQLMYYQPGIGTYTAPGFKGSIERWFANKLDFAVAWFLSGHVIAGYEFLMENFRPGDRICIFGFSRGAYTARALAGMLSNCGLLPKGNREQVPLVYRMYANGSDYQENFKRAFCRSVDIEFMGVWDTVASVGALIPRNLPMVSSRKIKHFRHAISLDERRIKFGVTLWDVEGEDITQYSKHGSGFKTSVKEVWFSGVHSDVGGGSEPDTAPKSLANISFRWMLHQIDQANCGIQFDDNALDAMNVPLNCVKRSEGHKAAGRIPTWDDADTADLVAGDHDQLREAPWWWIFQIPFWGGYRVYPGDHHHLKDQKHVSIHHTVGQRVDLVQGYVPRAMTKPHYTPIDVRRLVRLRK